MHAHDDMHLAEHAHLHVIEEMAVEGPAAGLIGGDEITQALAGLDEDGVLVGPEVAWPFSSSLQSPCRWIGCSIMVSLISTKRTRSPRASMNGLRPRRISCRRSPR